MKRKTVFKLCSLVVLVLAVGATGFARAEYESKVESRLPEGEVILLDDFEEGNYWAAVGDSWDQWGSHNLSLEAELSDDWGTEGPTSADWVYDVIPASGGQATFFCDQLLETDWTGARYVAIDIFNPEDFEIIIYFSSQSTDGWAWTQTQDLVVQPGENLNLAFSLTEGCMDGNNDPVPGIPGPDMMKRAMFSVKFAGSGGNSGRFYADNIRIIK